MDNDSSLPKELKWINGRVLSTSDCLETKWKDYPLDVPSEDQVCFKNNYEKGEGICNGDSGGPLVCNENGKAVLIGVTSHSSHSCVEDGYPNIFEKVAYFLSWIKDNMVVLICLKPHTI